MFSRCATNACSCTLPRAFLPFTHKAKNRRTPLATVRAVTILGGNYLIAQQLPASSPKASFFSIYESDRECKVFSKIFSRVILEILMNGHSDCNGYKPPLLTPSLAFAYAGFPPLYTAYMDILYTICSFIGSKSGERLFQSRYRNCCSGYLKEVAGKEWYHTHGK